MEDSNKKPELDLFKLFQPELLPLEELVDILREYQNQMRRASDYTLTAKKMLGAKTCRKGGRPVLDADVGIKMIAHVSKRGVGPVLLSQSREKLVSLFKRVALPLPQRELRDNYRGNLLKKLRKKAERIQIGVSSSSDLKGFTIGISGNPRLSKSTSRDEKSAFERLKPPPEVVNCEKKKIGLNSSSISSETVKISRSSDLDKVIIKRRKTSENSNESHNNRNGVKDDADKAVTNSVKVANDSENQSNNDTKKTEQEVNGDKTNTVTTCKKVSLKRNRFVAETASPTPVAKTVAENPKSTTEMLNTSTEKPEPEKEESPSEPDKKRKLITWP